MRVPVTPESALAHVTLAQLAAHEDLARRWAEARTTMVRETFADAYLSLVGIHPSRRSDFRSALEALRDGRTDGDVTVANLRHRIQVNGESWSGS